MPFEDEDGEDDELSFLWCTALLWEAKRLGVLQDCEWSWTNVDWRVSVTFYAKDVTVAHQHIGGLFRVLDCHMVRFACRGNTTIECLIDRLLYTFVNASRQTIRSFDRFFVCSHAWHSVVYSVVACLEVPFGHYVDRLLGWNRLSYELVFLRLSHSCRDSSQDKVISTPRANLNIRPMSINSCWEFYWWRRTDPFFMNIFECAS